MKALAALAGVLLGLFGAAAAPARASPIALFGAEAPGAGPAATAPVAIGDFRDRVGLDAATRLMRSPDAEERLRGLERAAAIRTPESLSLLLRAADATGAASLDPRLPAEGFARADPRALLVAVRTLAGFIDSDAARAALGAIVAAPSAAFATRLAAAPSADPVEDEIEGAARIGLARREAALALAGSGSGLAIEALMALARGNGPGQGPAFEALLAVPPTAPGVFAALTLTTPAMVALATEVSDLRTLDAVLAIVHAADPSLRAAAISALGVFGDTRGVDVARAAAHDGDPRVRIAAADALVHLGSTEAMRAVEGLIEDKRTAAAGLVLAERVSDEGVMKAAAALAAGSGENALRLGAVSAMGRSPGPLGVAALSALAADPALEASVANALARSPSDAAMRAIEAMATSGSARRLAARAYFARRYLRGEKSAKLDALLQGLALSSDPRDRAVAAEARVALGETSVEHGLSDRDPRVRRAAAMGAMAEGDRRTNALLVSRAAGETDRATRVALCAGLVDGDAAAALSTGDLVERAMGGGAEAPLATLALARRTAEAPRGAVDALLASHDPVLRSHAARGLGMSGAPDAIGRLVRAYAWEADVEVRRAIVRALRSASATTSALGHETLALAASLDPDAITRASARQALAGAGGPATPSIREVAWIKLSPADMTSVPDDETAMLIGSDGVARPIAFDDDGYALVVGIPPGPGRLRLAPRLPTYSP